jgi:hypothetical protein
MPSTLAYRVGFLGCPTRPDVEWNLANLSRLKDLDFNTIQLHIAWGSRPNDEPLNIEDVVTLAPDLEAVYPQPVPLRSEPSPQSRERRRANLHQRLELCRQLGLRTLFHFGAPYNAHARYGDNPPNCIMDEAVIRRYELLLETFAREFAGVDDILVYTYDQDAWLCGEFGECPRCKGVPLHERLTPFIDRLSTTWRRLSPEGRLWWSPWELSAGQVLQCVKLLNPDGLGLDLHPNVAETIATIPVDRWLKNVCSLAEERGIPVLVESFLGAASEEVEPYQYLAHPLVTRRQIAAIAAVPGVRGIKEYYGLLPDKPDPNLSMAGLCFQHPEKSEAELLHMLAAPYGLVAGRVGEYWRLCSTAQELFPWDVSWFAREVGKSDLSHSLSAAFIRGQQCHTPAWDSTRAAIFMKTDSAQPHPWMLEDLQLRFGLAAEKMMAALAVGQAIQDQVPSELAPAFGEGLKELDHLRRQVLAYAYHLRETNLATLMRQSRQSGHPAPQHWVDEMAGLLKADAQNQQTPAAHMSLEGSQWIWQPGARQVEGGPFRPCTFRKYFDVPQSKTITNAHLLYANSEFILRLNVNGHLIGAERACVLPFEVDLTPYLQSGANCIAARVFRSVGEAPRLGLIAKLHVGFNDGTSQTMISDGTWQSTSQSSDGWQCLNMDEGVWMNAEELAPFGAEPWGTKTFGDHGAGVQRALQVLQSDVDAFLDTYFQIAPDTASKGLFSVTSRWEKKPPGFRPWRYELYDYCAPLRTIKRAVRIQSS